MPAIFAIGQTDLILTMPRRLPKNTAVMLHDEYSVMCLEFRPERSTIEREALPNRKGQRGNVYQPHFLEKWNSQAPAYGRFWIDAQGGERTRKTVSLGRCATQSVARLQSFMRAWEKRIRQTHGSIGPMQTDRIMWRFI